MKALPTFLLGTGAFVGGLLLNGNAADRAIVASNQTPPTTATGAGVESIAGTLLAVAGLVAVGVSVVKATGER